jgi:toxin-antitoxin system PIN domain toxin
LTALIDVNLLVSIAWPNHVHHAPVLEWFGEASAGGWATTAFTEAGFVRVSSNAAAIATAVTPERAIAMLEQLRRVPGHRFLADDVQLVIASRLSRSHLRTHRNVTDAHLLALARRHRMPLATLDRGVAELAGERGDVILVGIDR